MIKGRWMLICHGNKFHINLLLRAKATAEQLNCSIFLDPEPWYLNSYVRYLLSAIWQGTP